MAVAEGCTFEEIRRRLVDHMASLSEHSPGTGNTALHQNATANARRYVLNVTEALKELMRLGLMDKSILPASAASAHAHSFARYSLTEAGQAWVETLQSSRPAGYDKLVSLLLAFHPQFRAFLGAVGAYDRAGRRAFVIPLLRWGDAPEPRTRDRYLSALAGWAANGLATSDCGWSATEADIGTAVASYTQHISDRAAARERPDPFKRNQDFVRASEEAMVKLAFAQAGLALDYISMEVLRRWTRTLALTNFSYHAPGPQALRIWATADIRETEGHLQIVRRVGKQWREQVPGILRSAFERARRSDATKSLWVPIYRVRAAVCWELRLPDSEFDAALLELLRGERGTDLPFRVNLDQSSYGSVPPSERPLVVNTTNGPRVFKSLSLVARATPSAPEGKELQ
jgi:hypothetical protein